MKKALIWLVLLMAGCHNPQTDMQLGNRAYLNGESGQALVRYQAALQDPETRAAASYNLGRLYLAQEEPGLALESFENAEGPELNLLRSRAYRMQGEKEKAKEALGTADDPSTSLERARIELGTPTEMKPDEMVALLEKARQDPVLSEEASLEIVRLREALGQNALAVAELEKLSRTHPQRLGTDQRLGNNLLKLNRFAEAETRFRRSIQRDGSFLPAYLGLGRALEGQGRKQEAMQVYQAMVSRLPAEDENVKEARRRLEAGGK